MPKSILDYTRAQDALKQDTIAPTEDNYAESLEHGAEDEEKLNVITFFLNGEEYALEVTEAVEVLKPRKFTEVPRTPSFIVGILSVRGEMVPVMDLKKRLSIGAAGEAPGRILITSIDDLKAGFIVDRLAGVKEVPVKSVDVTADKNGVPSQFLKGVIRHKEACIALLNTVRLIDITGA